jgi:16S rRNA processing protein RimM
MVAGAHRRVERRDGHDRLVILRLAGCNDRESAEMLRGAELLVAREQAPDLGDDEWWAEDLEGCRVLDAGIPVGIVATLLELPSCEVLEVIRDQPGGEMLLVPLISDAVRSVDLERGEIDVDLRFLGEEPGGQRTGRGEPPGPRSAGS